MCTWDKRVLNLPVLFLMARHLSGSAFCTGVCLIRHWDGFPYVGIGFGRWDFWMFMYILCILFVVDPTERLHIANGQVKDKSYVGCLHQNTNKMSTVLYYAVCSTWWMFVPWLFLTWSDITLTNTVIHLTLYTFMTPLVPPPNMYYCIHGEVVTPD